MPKVEIRPRKKSFKGTKFKAATPDSFRADNIENDVPIPTIGVPNPYGLGASAYEPETELWDEGSDMPLLKGYDDAFNAVQKSRQQEAQAQVSTVAPGTTAGAATGGSSTIKVKGQAGQFIAAAQSLLGKPYIWGGTTSRGVDCSGLLYFAFNQAGIKMPRYVASQYGKMGTQVTADAARPGDILYWDNAGPVDHVGIYLGNGQVLQAPQSGDVVKVSRVWGNPTYRRILDDAAFGEQAAPPGQKPILSYNGKAASKVLGVASPVNLFAGEVSNGSRFADRTVAVRLYAGSR